MLAPKNPRKVISIPVHFVSSATSSTSTSTSSNATSEKATSAAVKIQKVFRGLLVRKNLKKVVSIKREVDKAEERVLARLDAIRRDPKERLRMNETLMALLFRLDSVRGVGSGVRECRKAVIRKAIGLQEIIDGCDDVVNGRVDDADVANRVVESGDDISENCNQDMEIEGGVVFQDDVIEISNQDNGNDNISRNSNQGLEIEGGVVFDKDVIESDHGLEIEDGLEKVVVLDEKIDNSAYVTDRALEIEGKESSVGNISVSDAADVANRVGEMEGIEKVVVLDEKIDGSDEPGADVADQALETECKETCVGSEYDDKSNENIKEGDDDGYLAKLVKSDEFVEPEMEEDEEDYCMVKKVVVGEEDNYGTNPIENQVEDKAEICKNKEILEKMMEENVKMMNMMKQLSEQQQAQNQMLSLLSYRVEQLEKAFVRDLSRKKSKDNKKR